MATIRTTGYNTAAKVRNPVYTVGKQYRTVPARAALATASMTNGDILILAGPLTYSERIARILSPNATPALTAATDAKLGFFQMKAGVPALIKAGSDALLWNGVSFASALTARDLLFGLNASLDSTKNIGELLAQGVDQEPAGGVFLGLTFVTKPSNDGVLDLDVQIEEATTV